MILKLRPDPDDGWFSWRIAKNPGGSPFERDLSSKDDGTRRVVGRYEGGEYVVEVVDDPAALLDRLRAEGRASYVDARPFSVTPRALVAAAVALKSVVDGKVPSGVERERFFEPGRWRASVGPFALEDPTKTYSGLGLLVERSAACRDLRQAVAVDLAPAQPMSLTEFLQRVFVGAYATSARDGDRRRQESLVDHLARWSGWLKSCPNADFVVRRLSGYRTSVAARLEAALGLEDLKSGEKARVRLHERRHETVLRVLAGELMNGEDQAQHLCFIGYAQRWHSLASGNTPTVPPHSRHSRAGARAGPASRWAIPIAIAVAVKSLVSRKIGGAAAAARAAQRTESESSPFQVSTTTKSRAWPRARAASASASLSASFTRTSASPP